MNHSFKYCTFLSATLLIVILWGVHAIPTAAQANDINLDVNAQSALTNAQVLSLASLGIDRKGRGQTLTTLVLRNNRSAPADNLYFNIFVRSSRIGLIAEALQIPANPFSLNPLQVVTTNNNMIQDGISGISEQLNFNSRLTSQGEEFINSLKGSTRLPNDVYTLEVIISEGNNIRNGGAEIARASTIIGGASPTADTQDLFLRFPGNQLGNEAVIFNSLPEFNWDGESGIDYRILVVEKNGVDSPEALLQNAKSTQPTLNNNQSGPGSLLEFENVDAIVDKASFQMRPNGVQKLEPGNTYYWRVIALIRGAGQIQEINSEIWEFTVATREANDEQLNAALEERLKVILGADTFRQLKKDGFSLESIKLNGETFSGQSLPSKLQKFINRINNGEITTVVEQ